MYVTDDANMEPARVIIWLTRETAIAEPSSPRAATQAKSKYNVGLEAAFEKSLKARIPALTGPMNKNASVSK